MRSGMLRGILMNRLVLRTCLANEPPDQQPEKLGFPDMDEYPRSFVGRFIYPLRLPWGRGKKSGNDGGKSG